MSETLNCVEPEEVVKNTAVLYTYEYIWKLDNSDNLCFKVITDTIQGHEAFVKMLKDIPGLVLASRTYLHEIDCFKYHLDEPIVKDVIFKEEN